MTSFTTRQASRLGSWCRHAVNLKVVCQSKECESGYVKTQGLVARLMVGDMGIETEMSMDDAMRVMNEGVDCIHREVGGASVREIVNAPDPGENEARVRCRGPIRRIQ